MYFNACARKKRALPAIQLHALLATEATFRDHDFEMRGLDGAGRPIPINGQSMSRAGVASRLVRGGEAAVSRQVSHLSTGSPRKQNGSLELAFRRDAQVGQERLETEGCNCFWRLTRLDA